MWLAREQLMEGFGGRKAKIFGNVKVLIKKSWKWISPPSPPPPLQRRASWLCNTA